MARQCTKPKRPRNSAWFKEKMLLVQAQEEGQVLDEEQLAFLADPGIPDGQAIQTIIRQNAAFQTDDLDAYDSDCDDISSVKAILMANLSSYDLNVLSEVNEATKLLPTSGLMWPKRTAWVVDFFELQEPDSPEAAPASPDYVPGPEEPEQAPLLPDYDQPYAVANLPIALSPGDSDPEEDSEDGPVDYTADGDDGDDDSSDDDEEEEEASEEEHLAPVDSVVAPAPVPFPSEEEVERLLALPPTPPSSLISLSPPSAEERLDMCLATPALPSSPLPIVPHPYGIPNHVRAPPGFRAAMASLFIPPPVDRKEDIPEAELPPRKRLCLTALTSKYKVEESSTAPPRPTGGHRVDYGFIGTLDAETRRQRAEEVGYRIRDVWVDPREVVEELAPTTLKGVNARVTELAAVQEQDTHDIYAVINDTQDKQTQLFERVDVLVEDRQFHQETALLLDQEALASREARTHSVGLSSAIHFELQAYMTHTQMQEYRIASQESLTATLIAQVSSLQGLL
ncbi:hypothetical protein Tco_0843146 [Tanacetum coccineum]|uniref:Uncharacterized protein n=1 Tax=Tanacetum coccineum TaxID=301880 RepID=A0ABQ5B5L2_9ASTR